MIGQTISHYKIIEKLGEGGMGVVYKAEDTTLDRLVALKFLPPTLHAGGAEKARFVQEAKAAAALNHPNICSVIAIDESEGQMFIVMEFVDGQTLREKLGQISFKQAIDIGIQVADGLAAAHEKGIFHRDVKPENVMVRKDGIAQIMDFGLAKLRASGSKITRLTKEGSTVGTAGYMSPEQVQGHDTDHRADIFSYGVLLYELLTGQLPFKGVHETALAYEIVNVDAAPMSSVKPDIDPTLDAVVLDCLDKDPKERCQSIAEVARDLRRVKRESTRQRHSRITATLPAYAAKPSDVGLPGAPELGATKRAGHLPQLPWIAAILFFAGMVTFAAMYFMRPPVNKTIVRSSLLPPEKSSYSSFQGGGHFALSPDGLKMAFVVVDSLGQNRLWVRPLNVSTGLPLPGTEGASFPFWSPDNRFIGFFTGPKMKKVEATGGPPSVICDAIDGRGGTWNRDGVILLAPNWIGGLYQVSAAGGVPAAVTKLDTSHREQTHRWPSFLPDGRHFLYFARSSAGGAEAAEDAIYVSSLDGTVNNRLFSASSNVAYASGHILFMRQSAVMAVPFDHNSLALTGEAFPIAEQAGYEVNFNRGHFTVSDNGIFAFQPGASTSGARLSWFDRSGKLLRTLGEPALYGGGQLSRDEKKLVISVFDPQSRNRDIWIYDLSRGGRTRFTFDPGVEEYPVWSSDGSRIIYASDKKGHLDIYQKPVNGEGGEELLYASAMDKFPTDRSQDGRTLLYYTAGDPVTKSDLWALPLGGDRTPLPLLQTEFEEQDGQFSRDGKWIAYTSTESGRYDTYVRSFPGPSGKWQVSTSGLSQGTLNLAARWRGDGKELYYFSDDQKIMAAEIKTAGSSFEVGAVQPLFDRRSIGVLNLLAVSADGQRFLAASEAGQSFTPLTLVLNWDEELRNK